MHKFKAYVKDNPGASYVEASKVMQRTSRTIHRWCEELGIKLTTPALKSTAEEKRIPNELNGVIDEANRNVEYLRACCINLFHKLSGMVR